MSGQTQLRSRIRMRKGRRGPASRRTLTRSSPVSPHFVRFDKSPNPPGPSPVSPHFMRFDKSPNPPGPSPVSPHFMRSGKSPNPPGPSPVSPHFMRSGKSPNPPGPPPVSGSERSDRTLRTRWEAEPTFAAADTQYVAFRGFRQKKHIIPAQSILLIIIPDWCTELPGSCDT